MEKIVNIHTAKTHLSELLESVIQGNELIIAKRGRPIAKLVPLNKIQQRKLGFMKMEIDESFFMELPEEELLLWEK